MQSGRAASSLASDAVLGQWFFEPASRAPPPPREGPGGTLNRPPEPAPMFGRENAVRILRNNSRRLAHCLSKYLWTKASPPILWRGPDDAVAARVLDAEPGNCAQFFRVRPRQPDIGPGPKAP